MKYQQYFESALANIRSEGRYRIFTDLERDAARPPFAVWRNNGRAVSVVTWCFNDYLGMGRHPLVLEAMAAAPREVWRELGLPLAEAEGDRLAAD